MEERPASLSFTLMAAIVGVLVVSWLDFITGFEVRIFPLYFLPVAFVSLHFGYTASLAISTLCAVGWVVSNWLAGRVYSSVLVWPVNFTSQLVAFAVVGYLVVNIRQRLVAEQELSRLDPLTGLPNRRAFYELGTALLAVSVRSARPVALAYLDLDNFKKINDECGHKEGDRALCEIAAVLKRQLRASDVVCRLGGDEFAILMPETGLDAARSSLERVRGHVAEGMRQNAWPVTVSVGAVAYAIAPGSIDEAVRAADALMYRAKELGKDRLQVESIAPLG